MIDKKTYKNVVKFTVESMLEQAKKDKSYDFQADLQQYVQEKIVPDGVIRVCEFMEIVNEIIE